VALTEGSEEQLGFGKLRKAEDSALLAEGFDPAGGVLWRRDGTYFGREAALQNALRSLRQKLAGPGNNQAPSHPPALSILKSFEELQP
jgi:hypothetical protein